MSGNTIALLANKLTNYLDRISRISLNTVWLRQDAMNRRLYNNQSFVETAIYRVFDEQ
ncbi:MAG: hypothetical protein V7L09_12205 [Nostoc sp.]|uniref:hypothetical protein n=1 Tax=Nostoc sp. TaxID=1180 RepID=UPI002FF33457